MLKLPDPMNDDFILLGSDWAWILCSKRLHEYKEWPYHPCIAFLRVFFHVQLVSMISLGSQHCISFHSSLEINLSASAVDHLANDFCYSSCSVIDAFDVSLFSFPFPFFVGGGGGGPGSFRG